MTRPLTSSIDIYRAAAILVRQHGYEAPVFAAMRADELLADGDMDGRAVWLRILEAVKTLLAKEPEGTVH